MDKVFIESCPACLSAQLSPWLSVTDFRASKEVFELVHCAQCGLVITQHHPVEADIGHYYATEDYISHAEGSRSLMDRVYYSVRKAMARKKQKWIEHYAKGRKLIDIGAGTGFFAAHMHKHGWEVHGMEPNVQAREIALKLHGLSLDNTDALFRTTTRSADVVTMWHVLEHVHAPEQYLRRIYEILHDNGVLFLALPNYTALDAGFYKSYWGAWDVPRHLWHFSPRAALTMLNRCGFTLIHEYTLPFDAFYVALISEKYRGGGVLRALRGLAIGKWSLIESLFNRHRASSIVYVFTKTPHS